MMSRLSRLAHQQSELVGFVFPIVCVGQRTLALGDALPSRFLRQLHIEFDHVNLVGWRVFFGIDRVHRALWNADCAVNALIRINSQEIGAFAEAIHWAHINAIGVFTVNAGLGDNVGHDIRERVGVNP
jgi:hypothetical protein